MAVRSSALARDVAAARLKALEAERRVILATFPDLRIGLQRGQRVKSGAAERPRLVRAAKRRVVGAAKGGAQNTRVPRMRAGLVPRDARRTRTSRAQEPGGPTRSVDK
jgi:hypothetical protein